MMRASHRPSNGGSASWGSKSAPIPLPKPSSLQPHSHAPTVSCSTFNSAACRAWIYNDGLANWEHGHRSSSSPRMTPRPGATKRNEPVVRRSSPNPCPPSSSLRPSTRPSTQAATIATWAPSRQPEPATRNHDGEDKHAPWPPTAESLASTVEEPQRNVPRRPGLVYEHTAITAGPLMSNEMNETT